MYINRQTNHELMDAMIRQHITDRIDHAATVWDDGNGDWDLAQYILDKAHDFAAEVDECEHILWLDSLAR